MIQQIPLVREAKVISVDDKTDGDRIKVLLIPEDVNEKVTEYVKPLLPKMLHIKPKVGESVYIVTAMANDGHSQRYYIGPIITQPTHMEYEPYFIDSATLNSGYAVKPDEAPTMNPKTNGAFPKETDVSIEGRKNAGLQITDNDIRTKAGVKVSSKTTPRDVSFNRKNPAYSLIRYNDEPQKTNDGQKYNSTASIVADKINLISTNSKDGYNVTDPDDLISDEEMKKIIEKAHKLPYGDVLIEFLNLFRNAFLTHTHPFAGLPTTPDAAVMNVQNYNLKKILSDDIKIS